MAEAKGYSRTTVLNLIERLRKRGYLERKKREGVFRYSPTTERTDVMRMQVRNFVKQSLGGSLEPFMFYLAEEEAVDDQELDELMRIVAELDAKPIGQCAEGGQQMISELIHQLLKASLEGGAAIIVAYVVCRGIPKLPPMVRCWV